jgi:hypothetical protein
MMLRSRFKEYMNRLRIFRAPDQKLYLDSRLETDGIKLSPIGGGTQ